MDRRRWACALATVLFAAAGCGDPEATTPTARPTPPPPTKAPPVPETPPAPRVPPIRVIVREFAGTPIAGARVVARAAPQERDEGIWMARVSPLLADWRSPSASRDAKPAAEAVTGADGTASLAYLAAGRWTVSLDATGRVGRSASCSLAAGDPEPTVEIRAETGVPLAGRVVTSRGAAIADAAVVATFPAVTMGGRSERRDDSALARTDAEGRFRFDALPETVVGLQCAPPGAWSSHVWSVRTGAVASIDLVLDVRGPIDGRVSSVEDAKPLAGARVRFSAEGWHTARADATAVTDAEGRYRVPVFPGESVASIEVEAKGYWRVPRVIDARRPPFRLHEDEPTTLNLAVHADSPDRADVRGVVRGPDGPVAGASVFLAGPGDDYYMSSTFETDATGRFWFFDVPHRDLVVTVEADGLFQPGAAELEARDGVVLDPTSPLVIAADAVRPVERDVTLAHAVPDVPRAVSAEPRVTVTGRITASAGSPPGRGAHAEFEGSWIPADADGRFRFEFDVHYAREKDTFRAVVPGWGSKDVEFALPAGGGAVDAGEIVVEKGRTIRGRVTCGDSPVADAVITGERKRGGSGIGCTFDEDPSLPILAVSDAGGAFEISEFPPGDYVLHAAAPGYLASEGDVDATVRDVETMLVLQRQAHLRGRVVRANGQPVAGARVSIDFVAGEGKVTGEDGSFDLVVAEGVEQVVEVRPAWDHEDDFLECERAGLSAPCDPVEIRVSAGQSISGRVLGADGKPAAGVKVTCFPAGSHETYDGRDVTTDADGAFTVRALADGNYDVEVSQGVTEPVTVKDVEAGRRDVDVRLAPSLAIEGLLLDAAGKPARGMTLVASACDDEDQDSRRKIEARTDESGRFRFVGVGSAPCRIEIRGTGAGRISLYSDMSSLIGGSPVSAGVRDLVLRIPTKDAVTIAGRFVDDAGKPVAGEHATVPVRANVSAGVRSDDDGRFEVAGVRLDVPCAIAVGGAGIEWTLAVPAGTKDLVVTLGADGLHRVEIGGRAVEKAAARARVESAGDEHRYFPTARFVHAVTGATVERDSLGDGFAVDDLPIGPYRVEVRERRDGDWLPTREKRDASRPGLVVAE